MKLRPRTRSRLLAASAVALLLARPADGQDVSASDAAADRVQILSILEGWEEAWNRHDMAAFGALFHDDGVWVLWTGSVWSGRRAIVEGHAEVHETIFRNSVQRERVEELAFIGPNAAVVRFCSILTGDERSPDTVVRSRKVLVVTRRDGAWRVGWGQNTRLADSTPESDCFLELRKEIA